MQTKVPLSGYTTTGIGGPAQYFVSVKNLKDLTQALLFAQTEKLPYLVIGSGSNLLVSDQGYPGLIIKNDMGGISLQDQVLGVQSGTVLNNLINFTTQQGLSGLQKLAGIPGTVGGAIYGNAGAFGQAISDTLEEVNCFDPTKIIGESGPEVLTLSNKECQFSYRDSIFKTNKFTILGAKFKLEPADPSVLKQEIEEVLSHRTQYNDLKCPGSFFKNIPVSTLPKRVLNLIPEDKINHGKIPAGFLLESIGAKGQRVGDIMVSETHANLIINLRNGTSSDFYKLISALSQQVKERFGVTLEPEVQLINLPPIH